MDKNENGYPGGIVGGVTDDNSPDMGGNNRPGCCGGCGGMNDDMNGGMNDDMNGSGSVGGVTNHSCGGRGDCLDRMPLAYVYAPDQMFRMLYTANDALKKGTLFEELYKPMEVYGRE